MDFDDYEKLPTSNVTTYMTAGAVAGVMEHCVMYPLDSVKTQMQNLSPSSNAAYRGIGETLVRMVRQEGVFRPVRGMSAVVIGAAPAHALYFTCYEQIKDFITQTTKFTNVAYGVAGCASTVLHDLVMNPAEGIMEKRVRFSYLNGKGVMNTCQPSNLQSAEKIDSTTRISNTYKKVSGKYPTRYTSRQMANKLQRVSSRTLQTTGLTSQPYTSNESRQRSKFQKDLRLVEDLHQMLRDECEDIKHAMIVSQDRDQYSTERNPKNLALKLPAKKKTYRLRSELIRIHQEKKDSVIPAIPEVEETDDLLPEVAAAIMHTEEQGIHLGMTPRRMFDHLFPAPSGRDEPLLPVSFVAPSRPLDDVVIPLGTPGFNVAVEEAAIIASAVDDNVAQPKESIFSESFTEQTVKPKHDITSTDPRTIEYYVGGSISSTTTSSTSSDHWENVEAMPDKDRQEFLHMAETQSHFSQIQLRGTKPPPWFPGYYLALPETDGPTSLESPSQVMLSAWKAVHPNMFEGEERILINK